jgi:hypothetical protein
VRRPRLHWLRNALGAVLFVGATILTMTGQAAATGPWQKSWGDYVCQDRWHDASWWLQYRHAWVAAHHPEWTESYAQTFGQIDDYDRLHRWHYGDGGFDRNPTGLPTDEMTSGLSKARERHLNLRPSTAFAHRSKPMKPIDSEKQW